MGYAKSARVRRALGASLVAIFSTSSVSAAIHGSGTEAIHGSGTEAIHGSGTEAIHGSGTDAIHGSGALAIHGSGTDAIHGSGIDAIHGSGTGAIHGSGAAAIHGSGIELLAGPIYSIDYANNSFTSLGQEVTFAGGVGSLAVGNFVTVSGEISGAGMIVATGIFVSPYNYVPGATEVYVTGIPSSVDLALGTARIGDLTVDYTPSLGGSGFGGFGAAITVIGTQPAFGGTMLSDRVIDKTDLFLEGRRLR